MNQKDFINNYNFKFKKKFGQNFLLDDNVLNNIVNSANIDKKTLVIEIGCGAGALTRKILEHTDMVVGYEIDETLTPILSTIEKAKILFKDFLKANVKADINEYNYDKLYVVANLPYYITTPIINKIITDNLEVDKIVVMVQKEVGDRFTSKCGTKDYSSITVFLNYFFDIRKEFIVSKNAFYPKPNVDSMIISLNKKINKIKSNNEELFFKLVRDSFKFKRKTIRNNLKNYNLEIIEEVLKKYNMDLKTRAEEMPLDVFIDLANSLNK